MIFFKKYSNKNFVQFLNRSLASLLSVLLLAEAPVFAGVPLMPAWQETVSFEQIKQFKQEFIDRRFVIEKDHLTSKISNDKPLTLLIADQHGNAKAQTSILSLINWVREAHPGALFLAEGVVGSLNLEGFETNTPTQHANTVLKVWFEKGELTPLERSFLESPAPNKVFGLEEVNLYLQNLQSYWQVESVSSKTHQALDRIFSALSSQIASKADLKFLAMNRLESFLSALQMNPNTAIQLLTKQIEKLPLEQLTVIRQKFPALHSLCAVTNPALSGQAKQQLLQSMHQPVFLDQLNQEYPVFYQWIVTSQLKDEALAHFLSARPWLEDLVSLKLTPQGYEALNDSIQSMLDAMIQRLSAESLTPPEQIELTAAMAQAKRFYQLVRERDGIFSDKFDQYLKSFHGQKIFVVIMGGFHTNHFEQFLESKALPYLIVKPKSAGEINFYENKMADLARLAGYTISLPLVLEAPDYADRLSDDPIVEHLSDQRKQLLAEISASHSELRAPRAASSWFSRAVNPKTFSALSLAAVMGFVSACTTHQAPDLPASQRLDLSPKQGTIETTPSNLQDSVRQSNPVIAQRLVVFKAYLEYLKTLPEYRDWRLNLGIDSLLDTVTSLENGSTESSHFTDAIAFALTLEGSPGPSLFDTIPVEDDSWMPFWGFTTPFGYEIGPTRVNKEIISQDTQTALTLVQEIIRLRQVIRDQSLTVIGYMEAVEQENLKLLQLVTDTYLLVQQKQLFQTPGVRESIAGADIRQLDHQIKELAHQIKVQITNVNLAQASVNLALSNNVQDVRQWMARTGAGERSVFNTLNNVYAGRTLTGIESLPQIPYLKLQNNVYHVDPAGLSGLLQTLQSAGVLNTDQTGWMLLWSQQQIEVAREQLNREARAAQMRQAVNQVSESSDSLDLHIQMAIDLENLRQARFGLNPEITAGIDTFFEGSPREGISSFTLGMSVPLSVTLQLSTSNTHLLIRQAEMDIESTRLTQAEVYKYAADSWGTYADLSDQYDESLAAAAEHLGIQQIGLARLGRALDNSVTYNSPLTPDAIPSRLQIQAVPAMIDVLNTRFQSASVEILATYNVWRMAIAGGDIEQSEKDKNSGTGDIDQLKQETGIEEGDRSELRSEGFMSSAEFKQKVLDIAGAYAYRKLRLQHSKTYHLSFMGHLFSFSLDAGDRVALNDFLLPYEWLRSKSLRSGVASVALILLKAEIEHRELSEYVSAQNPERDAESREYALFAYHLSSVIARLISNGLESGFEDQASILKRIAETSTFQNNFFLQALTQTLQKPAFLSVASSGLDAIHAQVYSTLKSWENPKLVFVPKTQEEADEAMTQLKALLPHYRQFRINNQYIEQSDRTSAFHQGAEIFERGARLSVQHTLLGVIIGGVLVLAAAAVILLVLPFPGRKNVPASLDQLQQQTAHDAVIPDAVEKSAPIQINDQRISETVTDSQKTAAAESAGSEELSDVKNNVASKQTLPNDGEVDRSIPTEENVSADLTHIPLNHVPAGIWKGYTPRLPRQVLIKTEAGDSKTVSLPEALGLLEKSFQEITRQVSRQHQQDTQKDLGIESLFEIPWQPDQVSHVLETSGLDTSAEFNYLINLALLKINQANRELSDWVDLGYTPEHVFLVYYAEVMVTLRDLGNAIQRETEAASLAVIDNNEQVLTFSIQLSALDLAKISRFQLVLTGGGYTVPVNASKVFWLNQGFLPDKPGAISLMGVINDNGAASIVRGLPNQLTLSVTEGETSIPVRLATAKDTVQTIELNAHNSGRLTVPFFTEVKKGDPLVFDPVLEANIQGLRNQITDLTTKQKLFQSDLPFVEETVFDLKFGVSIDRFDEILLELERAIQQLEEKRLRALESGLLVPPLPGDQPSTLGRIVDNRKSELRVTVPNGALYQLYELVALLTLSVVPGVVRADRFVPWSGSLTDAYRRREVMQSITNQIGKSALGRQLVLAASKKAETKRHAVGSQINQVLVTDAAALSLAGFEKWSRFLPEPGQLSWYLLVGKSEAVTSDFKAILKAVSKYKPTVILYDGTPNLNRVLAQAAQRANLLEAGTIKMIVKDGLAQLTPSRDVSGKLLATAFDRQVDGEFETILYGQLLSLTDPRELPVAFQGSVTFVAEGIFRVDFLGLLETTKAIAVSA